MRISDWSSDVCSSDLTAGLGGFPSAAKRLVERCKLAEPRRARLKMEPVGRAERELCLQQPRQILFAGDIAPSHQFDRLSRSGERRGTFLLDGARRYVPAYAGIAVGQRTQHRAFIAGLGTIRARVRSADLRTDPSTREDRPAQRRAKLKTQAVARVQIAQRERLQADPEDRKSTRLNSSHYCASRMLSSAGKKQRKTHMI